MNQTWSVCPTFIRLKVNKPVTKEAILRLAAATLAPIVPLALTMMSLEELLKKLFDMRGCAVSVIVSLRSASSVVTTPPALSPCRPAPG